MHALVFLKKHHHVFHLQQKDKYQDLLFDPSEYLLILLLLVILFQDLSKTMQGQVYKSHDNDL